MNDNKFPWIVLFPFLVGVFTLGALFGTVLQKKASTEAAVASGHAEWVSDSKGQAVFKWKESK
jgi:hypothetical protein